MLASTARRYKTYLENVFGARDRTVLRIGPQPAQRGTAGRQLVVERVVFSRRSKERSFASSIFTAYMYLCCCDGDAMMRSLYIYAYMHVCIRGVYLSIWLNRIVSAKQLPARMVFASGYTRKGVLNHQGYVYNYVFFLLPATGLYKKEVHLLCVRGQPVHMHMVYVLCSHIS